MNQDSMTSGARVVVFFIELQTPLNTSTKRCKVPALLQTCTHAYNTPTSINTTDTNKSWPHNQLLFPCYSIMFTHTHTHTNTHMFLPLNLSLSFYYVGMPTLLVISHKIVSPFNCVIDVQRREGYCLCVCVCGIILFSGKAVRYTGISNYQGIKSLGQRYFSSLPPSSKHQ